MIISSLQPITHIMEAQHIDVSLVLDVGTLDRHGTFIENLLP